jgi:hypothetical protein
MTDIIISEFIDAPTLEALQSEFKVHYDPDLVSKPDELARLRRGTRDVRAAAGGCRHRQPARAADR